MSNPNLEVKTARRPCESASKCAGGRLYAVVIVLAIAAAGCTETYDAGANSPHGLLPVDERNPIVLVNDSDTTNVTWQNFTSSTLWVPLPTNGTYLVTVGLRSASSKAIGSWQSLRVFCDTTPLALALTNLATFSGSRPFLDPAGYESGLSALVGRGFQVDLVQILAPDELSPSTFGDLRLVDSEAGAMQEVTFGRFRLKAYRQTVQNFMQRLREYSQARGINFFSASSSTELQELLLKQLRRAEVWG